MSDKCLVLVPCLPRQAWPLSYRGMGIVPRETQGGCLMQFPSIVEGPSGSEPVEEQPRGRARRLAHA